MDVCDNSLLVLVEWYAALHHVVLPPKKGRLSSSLFFPRKKSPKLPSKLFPRSHLGVVGRRLCWIPANPPDFSAGFRSYRAWGTPGAAVMASASVGGGHWALTNITITTRFPSAPPRLRPSRRSRRRGRSRWR